MVMSLSAHLAKMDLNLLEAAHDLGVCPVEAFFHLTVPLSRNRIISGNLLVVIPAVGGYVIQDLLGGSSTLMIGRLMWDDFFSTTPFGR
jgi:putrescine transport system permease protein